MSRRRSFTAEFKARVVLELLGGQKSLAQASREYGIKDTVLSRWKQEFIERAPQLFARGEAHSQEAARMAELERMVGRLTLDLEAAKKALQLSTSLPSGNGR